MSHLWILVIVFFVMTGIVETIPELFALFRERYLSSTVQTSRELDKFFIKLKPSKIFFISLGLGALFGILLQSFVIAIAMLITGLVAPKLILMIYKDIRTGQVEAQLMDALIQISNSMKSGLDIAAGIERVANTMSPPISEEFGLVMNAYRLGTPLETALMDLTSRIKSRALETVVYAISIQRETGGNLIKTFDQLVATIREESKLQKKVKALTSQGRTQIFFLAGFPWALAVLFFVISPDFMRPAIANPWGQLVILFLIIWEAIGIIVTKRIVTVDI